MKQVKIRSITKLPIKSKRYDITVAENNNFFANGILVHNSYINLFWYDNEMVVTSRGSFTSPHALEAEKILNEKYNKSLKHIRNFCHNFGEPTTFVFELIGFEQIVVSYPESDLVLTGIFKGKKLPNCGVGDFKEHSPDLFVKEFGYGLKTAKKFDGLDWKNIKGLNWQNAEGFVVRFSNGQRCKIKFEDYIKLHRQMTNLSTRGIWEALAAGEPVSSILNDVPDEFYDKVHDYETMLKKQYADLESDIKVRFTFESITVSQLEGIEKRKTFAVNVSKYPHRSALFAMLDGKDYSDHIWKKIEPKFEKL